MTIRIADIPTSNRPRERLAMVGLGGLTDAELIALVIRSGSTGRNAVDVAGELLAQHGSLASLAAARVEEVARVASMGQAKASSLVAAFELGRRAATTANDLRLIREPQDVVAALQPHLSERRREEAWIVVLNGAHRLVKIERITSGGQDRCLIPIRDVLATVLRHDGIGFALAHTHPSGRPHPSSEDVRVTRALDNAARAAELRFLDHLVIAGDRWASLRRLGHFPVRETSPAQ